MEQADPDLLHTLEEVLLLELAQVHLVLLLTGVLKELASVDGDGLEVDVHRFVKSFQLVLL